MLDDPERHAATSTLRRAILSDITRGWAYLAAEASMEPDWIRGMASSDSFMHLTAEELREMRGELEDLEARWTARSDADRADARAVTLIYHAFRRP